MKRPVLFILLLMLMLTACSEREAPPVSTDAVTDTPVVTTAAESTAPAEIPMPAPHTPFVLTDAVPTLDAIRQAYTYAAEIWDTLHISTLPVYGGAQYDRDGWLPVRDFATMADFAARLRESFTAELTESLLSELSRFYREIDGRLYAVPADRGTDAEAGDSYITILPGKADTYRVIRTTMVMDTCHGASYADSLAYPAAQSQTELTLVYEDGRWVFAEFADRDDLSDLESGGGMKFVHARDVAMAYLAYESAKSGPTREPLDRYMKFYRENPDGSATFTMQIDEDPHDALPGEEREFTAAQNAAGVWQIIDAAALPAVEPREAMILTGAAIPSEADVLQAYNHALDIWVDSHGDMLDYHHDEAYRRDRMYLLRQYATRADVLARLRESFTEALAAEILNRMFESIYAYYAEIDGRVYVSDVGIGGNERAGAAVCEVTAVDENTVKLSRRVHVLAKPADPVYDYFWLPVGVSVQELTLVRENGRWVFANFMDSDDIAAYDAGQGTAFAHSKAVAAAFLDAEKASGVTMPEGYMARRSMKTYCEHADGTAAFTMLIDVFADGQYREAEREYTAVQNAAGEWEIVDFVAPGTIAAALLRGDTVLVPLTDAAIPSEADALRLIAHASILERMQLETLAADKSAPAVDSYYYPVRDYPTLAALKARLCECFSAAYAGRIVDWMLATAYREIDGRLYVTEASGGLNELGECRITGVERIDDRTALIHREKEVYDRAVYEDAEIFDVIYYIVGTSPQTLTMIYEGGHWVLDDFKPWYDESAYMEGGGMRIEGAAEIAEAFLAAEHAPAALTLDASRIFEWSYTELADIRRDGDRAVVTAEIRVKEKGYFYDFTQENIAVKTADGWEFEAPFISSSLAATIGLLLREAPAPTPKAGNFVPCTDPAVPSAEEIVRLAEHAARAREDGVPEVGGVPGTHLRTDWGFLGPALDYATLADYEARLRESYSDALVRERLDHPRKHLLEIAGRLFVLDAAMGGDWRAGDFTYEAEVIDDTHVMVRRMCEVYDTVGDFDSRHYIWTPLGLSPQEMPLVYEGGRWVFEAIPRGDDLSAFDAGQGIRYAHAEEIALAYLEAERAAMGDALEGYSFYARDRQIEAFRENADGSVTVTVRMFARTGRAVDLVREYTAVEDGGKWTFAGEFAVFADVINDAQNIFPSPDGKLTLRLTPADTDLPPDPFVGTRYDLSLVDASGTVLHYQPERYGEFTTEISWSPDSRYVAVIDSYRHYYSTIDVITTSGERFSLPWMEELEAVVGELVYYDEEIRLAFDRIFCTLAEWGDDEIKVEVHLRSAAGGGVEAGWYRYDLAARRITSYEFLDEVLKG